MITKENGKIIRINNFDDEWHITILLDSNDYATTYKNIMAPLTKQNIGDRLYGLIQRLGPIRPSQPMPSELYDVDVIAEHDNGLLLYVELYGPSREGI